MSGPGSAVPGRGRGARGGSRAGTEDGPKVGRGRVPAPGPGEIRVTLMGTGTSTGVPRIACDCPVCTSPDPRNRRLRAGVLVETARGNLLIDTSPDLRLQALENDVRRVDGVLYTHAHADHIYGLDDLRVFNFIQGSELPCYGSRQTLATVRRYFAYVFDDVPQESSKPHLSLVPVREPFEVLGTEVVPVPVWHGGMEVYGYRLGGFALVTDVSRIPDAGYELLEGLDVLVLGALRHRPHPTHLSFEQALSEARRIGARRTLLTHVSHEVDHAAPGVALPEGVEIAHDGLTFAVPVPAAAR